MMILLALCRHSGHQRSLQGQADQHRFEAGLKRYRNLSSRPSERSEREQGPMTTVFATSHDPWSWVPAFAGTTSASMPMRALFLILSHAFPRHRPPADVAAAKALGPADFFDRRVGAPPRVL